MLNTEQQKETLRRLLPFLSSFQGVKADFIHLDEVPNFKVYQEALIRTQGHLMKIFEIKWVKEFHRPIQLPS